MKLFGRLDIVPLPDIQARWVSVLGGSDTLGDGSSINPYQTIAAAENSITDASAAKPYVVYLGPGTHDVTTLTTKKSYVGWIGAGAQTTFIDNDHSGPIALTNTGFAVPSTPHEFNFTDMHFLFDVSMDTTFVGLDPSSDVRYWFTSCHFASTVLAVGLGADTVAVFTEGCFLNAGYTYTSIYGVVTGGFLASNLFVNGAGGLGCQVLNLASTDLGNVTVTGTDGTFVLFGLVGGIIGTSLTLDGSATQGVIDSGALTNEPTLLNGAAIQYTSLSQHVVYSPTTPGDWTSPPNNVRDALDQLAAAGGGATTSAEQDITSISWVGTSDPSGTIKQRYQWSRVGDSVTLQWRITADTPGVANTRVVFNLPSDCPAPQLFTNQTDNTWITMAPGAVLSSGADDIIGAGSAGLYRTSPNNYQIITTSGAAAVNAAFAAGSMTYLANTDACNFNPTSFICFVTDCNAEYAGNDCGIQDCLDYAASNC